MKEVVANYLIYSNHSQQLQPDPLVEKSKTSPFQGEDYGFESRMGHHRMLA